MDWFRKKNSREPVEREEERYEVALRVMSRDLPDYRAVTVDISRSGVQLETGALLNVGAEPVLKFEFDRGELESFECKALVVWSKPCENSKRRFLSGLSFAPRTDDEKRQIVRMATVLQARADADLETLLDQALRVDPELEATFLYQKEAQRRVPTAPVPLGANQPLPQVSAPGAVAKSPPKLGLYIPLNVLLEGFTWNRDTRILHLGLREHDRVYSLFFPNCQMFQVLEPTLADSIVGLYSAATSPVTRKLELFQSEIRYKHYRFVGEGGKGIVDIISGWCQSSLGEARA